MEKALQRSSAVIRLPAVLLIALLMGSCTAHDSSGHPYRQRSSPLPSARSLFQLMQRSMAHTGSFRVTGYDAYDAPGRYGDAQRFVADVSLREPAERDRGEGTSTSYPLLGRPFTSTASFESVNIGHHFVLVEDGSVSCGGVVPNDRLPTYSWREVVEGLRHLRTREFRNLGASKVGGVGVWRLRRFMVSVAGHVRVVLRGEFDLSQRSGLLLREVWFVESKRSKRVLSTRRIENLYSHYGEHVNIKWPRLTVQELPGVETPETGCPFLKPAGKRSG